MTEQAKARKGVALVTGAASGIGRALTIALCRQGREVALCDLAPTPLANLAAWLRNELGANVCAHVLDVRDARHAEQVVNSIEDEFGAIDAVALVAGVLHLGDACGVSEEAWHESLSTNAGGVFNVARAVMPRMVQRKHGALVTVASNAGGTPRLDMAAYCASKAAAIMYTKCLGLAVAQHGVRCNVVCPGSTDTPMLRAMLGNEPHALAKAIQGDLERHRLGIPLGRVASPEDIAQAVMFLLSDAARHVTLQELYVDGGATL
ncbi:MAG TPA: 2,3-dihydro-2,3-dihydroxybenzoate dehydrogenase [Polyangiales bacterium]